MIVFEKQVPTVLELQRGSKKLHKCHWMQEEKQCKKRDPLLFFLTSCQRHDERRLPTAAHRLQCGKLGPVPVLLPLTLLKPGCALPGELIAARRPLSLLEGCSISEYFRLIFFKYIL